VAKGPTPEQSIATKELLALTRQIVEAQNNIRIKEGEILSKRERNLEVAKAEAAIHKTQIDFMAKTREQQDAYIKQEETRLEYAKTHGTLSQQEIDLKESALEVAKEIHTIKKADSAESKELLDLERKRLKTQIEQTEAQEEILGKHKKSKEALK